MTTKIRGLQEFLNIHNEIHTHTDADQIVGWMRRAPQAPAHTFITHAEPEAADALRVRRELGWSIRSPQLGEAVPIAVP